MEKLVVALETVFWSEGYDRLVNHADFWALAASMGLEAGLRGASNSELCFDYYWGRTECKTAPLSQKINTFPDPAMALEEMFDYYEQTFGFSPKEVV